MPCHWRKLLVKCLTWTWRLHALSLEKAAGQVFDMDLETSNKRRANNKTRMTTQ